MQPGETLLALGLVAAIGLSLSQDAAAKIGAGIMAAMWIICMAACHFGTWGFASHLGKDLDVVAGGVFMLAWRKWPRNWLIVGACLFALQIAAHGAYEDGPQTKAREGLLWLQLNVITWLELLVIVAGPRARGVKIGIASLQNMFSGPNTRYRPRHGLKAQTKRIEK